MKTRYAVFIAALLITLALTGCGLSQSIGEGTKGLFASSITTLNLDVLNLTSSSPGTVSPVVVRVYQLKTATRFNALDGTELIANDSHTLAPDVLQTHDVVLRPGASISFSTPLREGTAYVGLVALIPSVGSPQTTAKLLVPLAQWKKDNPVKVELREDHLQLAGK